MNKRYPNAWNFSNSDKNLIAPNGKLRIEYGEQYEIAMGAPLGAECFLIIEDNERIKISDWAGGPAIWNSESDKVTFPIWTKNRAQQIRVVDLNVEKIITFSQIFRVLELEKFENSKIIGVDSPIHMTKILKFDTQTEKRQTETELKINRKLVF